MNCVEGFNCEWCDAPLTGGKDTFGRVGESFCIFCYLSLQEDMVAFTLEQRGLEQEHKEAIQLVANIEAEIKRGAIERNAEDTARLAHAKEKEDGLFWASKFAAPRYADRKVW